MTARPADIVFRTDVLVIGGGMAGAWAAAMAARAGASVILVDKGYCGTSGVTATAGPGHWWVPPDPPEARPAAIEVRANAGLGLCDPDWMARVIALTWETLPTLANYYDFSRDAAGAVQYRGLRGPEYMRALRHLIADLGVTILDQSPTLELLQRSDRSIGGARGIRRQQNNAPYRVESGATVLATGGTSFMSHLLGSRTNTGDGYLMAAEAGADLSGMEFTAAYTVAPKHSTMTRSMSYAFATYYDSDGHEVAPAGPDQMHALARQLLRGPVFCSLHRMPQDIRAHLPTISPNLMLPFARWGIDPFTDRFEVTLHNDGTIRGTGGVRVVSDDCATSVPGLFVAGDVATRELVAGATSGGGAQNSAWALSSGHWAGRGAVAFARNRERRVKDRLTPIGEAGLRPLDSARASEPPAIVQAIRDEMHPFDKNLFRTGAKLLWSKATLDSIWDEVRHHAGGTPANPLPAREAAALLATARWSLTAALARDESRGLHQRQDRPETNPRFARRIVVSGLDSISTRLEDEPAPTALEPAL
jgi:succinate dehydrogenase/fumarate reductase flavoprotein subunit